MLPGIVVTLIVGGTIATGSGITYLTYTIYNRRIRRDGESRAQPDVELGDMHSSRNPTPAPLPPPKVKTKPHSPYSLAPARWSEGTTTTNEETTAELPATPFSPPPRLEINTSTVKSEEAKLEDKARLRESNDDDGWTEHRFGVRRASSDDGAWTERTRRTETRPSNDDDAWTDVDMYEQSAVTGFDFGFGGSSWVTEKRTSKATSAGQ
jgi:hypothetical protein